jgi:hypothetical protein
MKKLAMMTASLAVLGGAAFAQAPVTTTTSTTAQTPVGTVTTTTDVTTPAPAPIVPPAAAPVPTARDAISGQPVDHNAAADANDDLSLRDKVRSQISNEAQVKQ